MSTPDLTTGLMSFVVFLYSTTIHEAAHAWTAWKLGDDTAYRGGQVSFLDPTPHVKREPIGMVVVPLLAYFAGGGRMLGWASAPYNPEWALRFPRRSAIMALAGPAANLSLVLLAALGVRAGMLAGVFASPDAIDWTHVTAATTAGPWPFLAALLSVAFSLNLLLFAFNLLPVPPLDGSSLPLLFLSGRAAESYTGFLRQPAFAMLGLVVAWRAFDTIFPALRLLAVNLLYPGSDYHHF